MEGRGGDQTRGRATEHARGGTPRRRGADSREVRSRRGRAAGTQGSGQRGEGSPRLNATWGRASEVLALRADGLQVEIADRQNDARLQPGTPHQAPRRADRRLRGPGDHKQNELQRQQQGPREAAHGRRASAVQLAGCREGRGAPRAGAGARSRAGGSAAAHRPAPGCLPAGTRARGVVTRLAHCGGSRPLLPPASLTPFRTEIVGPAQRGGG